MKDTRPFYIRRKNELIVGKQNYFNGSVALVGEEFDGCICSNAIMSFSVKPEIIPKYILAVVSQTDFINRRAYLANGTGQKELSETDFLNFTVQIATKEEQTRIADFFTKLDEQIEVEKAILEKWKLLKKGFLQQMFI